MNYFVSAEDIAYHHWQLELLIESFKLHGLIDKLSIGVAENNEEKLVDFTHNLKIAQKQIFRHDNVGRRRGCLSLNKPYSLYAALTQGLITQPVTLIDPDMILVSPVSEPVENVVYHNNPLFTCDYVEQNHCPVKKHVREIMEIRKIEDIGVDYWISLGSVMTFKDVPKDFFSRVIEWTERLEYERKRKSDNEWRHTEKAAWIMTMLEFYGHLSYHGRNDYEMTLLDNRNANFIHYTHGMPPVFSKFMYSYKPPHAFAMGNLFEVLLQNNPTVSTNYMQKVVKSYVNLRPPEKKSSKILEFKVQQVTVK